MSAEVAPIFDLVRDQWSGRRLGRFEIICKLGAGGMSEVFLSWQRSVAGFERPVVLKRILDQVKGQEDFVHMFVQEAKITSSLSHGNIAQLYDLSEENGELFMVMEFVPGATLVEVARACLNAREPIPVGLSLAVVRDTALALHYAHCFKDATGRSRPVIHRDVAEKNIMVSLDGVTKLLDFGIARQAGRSSRTQVGTVKGTAGYMSPEQVRGEKLDARTDVFSLGIVLHECLTGQRLFKAATRNEEIQALLEGPIPAPSQRNRAIPMQLDSVVLKALSRDRQNRYGSGLELAQALEKVAAADLWSEEQRAGFMASHFLKRREQIRGFLGDPGLSDAGEPRPASDLEPMTMIAIPGRDVPNSARTRDESNSGARKTAELTPQGARPTVESAPPLVGRNALQTDPGATRDDREVRAGAGASQDDAGATLPGESEESVVTHSGARQPVDEVTSAPEHAPPRPKRKAPPSSGSTLQVVAMVAGGLVLVAAILLVLLL